MRDPDQLAVRLSRGTISFLLIALLLSATSRPLPSVQEVWCHAERCLKKDHLEEAFRRFGFEDVLETAVPQSLQESSLHPLIGRECDF